MAQTTNISPPSEWIDVLERVEEDLCWQLAFEQVIINYDEVLIPEVVEELRRVDPETGKALLTQNEWAIDTLIRRNIFGMPIIEYAEDKIREIEGSLLGFHFSLMGNRTTSDPNKVRPGDSQPELPASSGAWMFRFREKLNGIAVKSEGSFLATPATKDWLAKRFASGTGYRNILFEEIAILHDFVDAQPLIFVDELDRSAGEVSELITKAQTSGPRGIQVHANDLLNNPDFVRLQTEAFKIIKKLFYGTGGYFNADGTVVLGDDGLLSQDCIDRNIDGIIKSLVGQLPGRIRQTQQDIEQDVLGIRQALITNPEELTRLVEYQPPKLTPFDFQCFLLENIGKIVDQRRAGGSFAPDYNNVIAVETNGDPGTVLNRIQLGGSDRIAQTREFLNICPEVYGLLVPYLKISRMEYEADGRIKINPKTNKAVVKDLKIPNFLTEQQVSDILSPNLGRQPGAGIKSFSWSLEGVQPAEVDNNITAELVMHFQSVNDFFRGAQQAGEGEPNFLDLIVNSPGVSEYKNTKGRGTRPSQKSCTDDLLRRNMFRTYEGANFRVKVTAGWATPPQQALYELVKDKAKADRLIAALNNSRVTLFLQMTQHQINFNQNGTLELRVNYRASLAGLLSGRTANIFDESGRLLDADIARVENEIDSIEGQDDDNDMSTSDQQKVAALTKELKQLRNIDRNVKYKKLLKRLYRPRTGGSGAGSSRIFNISVNPFELTLTPYADLTPAQRARRVKRRNADTLQIDEIPAAQSDILKAINENKDASGNDLGDAYSDIASKRFDNIVSNKKVNIPFFFLGDLFDEILEQLKDNYPDELDALAGLNFKFFISDVEMIDPLQAFKVQNLARLIECGYNLREIRQVEAFTGEEPLKYTQLNGIFRTMNIGDIPISLEAFEVWFKNNVIKNDRSNYFFLFFVKDICAGLITEALSSKCFGSEFRFQQRFDAAPLTLGKKKGGTSFFSPKKRPSINDVGRAKKSIYADIEPSEVELGILLYSTDSMPRNLNGKYLDDLKKGIYHHYLGSSCGLVKNINFQREDQPYVREGRIQKQGALGPEQLRELYSINMDLVGNILYTNGMYVYINPSLLGADKDVLDFLGLHGYYLVSSVGSTITPSSFDVSIRCLQEGVEFRDNALQPSAVLIDEPASPEQSPLDPPDRPFDPNIKIAAAIAEGAGSEYDYFGLALNDEIAAIGEAFARGDINIAEAAARTAAVTKALGMEKFDNLLLDLYRQ